MISEQGERFGESRLVALFTEQAENQTLDSLYEAIEQFSSKEEPIPISLLMLSFPVINAKLIPSSSESLLSPIPCKSELYFPAYVLKQVVVMNEVRVFLKGIIHTSYHLDFLCEILSELFSHMIEQRLLRLPMSLKEDPEGFSRYHQLRDIGLQALTEGDYVTCEVNYQPQNQSIEFYLTHSGQVEQLSEYPTIMDNDFLFAAQLCESLHYLHAGQTLHAVYRFDTPPIFPDIAHFINR